MGEPVPALRCECGKLLRLPETPGPTRLRCPACGRSITLSFETPGEAASAPAGPVSPSTGSGPCPSAEVGAGSSSNGGRAPAGPDTPPPAPASGLRAPAGRTTPEDAIYLARDDELGEDGPLSGLAGPAAPQGGRQEPAAGAAPTGLAGTERLLLEEGRFLRKLGYLPAEGWVMTFQRPDLPPEQEPAAGAEGLMLCVGRLVQSDHFVPVILVVPVVESDTGSRHTLDRGLNIARRTTPVPVPLCLVTRGDRRRMFQTEGERPYDTLVQADKAIGYLRGRSQRLVPALRFVDYPLLVREVTSVLESEGPAVGFDRPAFQQELRDRFATDDPDALRLAQARQVTAELLERFASRTPFRLLDLRLLTDQPAPEFDRLGTIVREKLAFEEYVEDRRAHAKRMFNILALGCFVAIFLSLAERVILPASILALTLFLVFSQEYNRPVLPRFSVFEVPRTWVWDRSVTERFLLGSLFLLVLLFRLFLWK